MAVNFTPNIGLAKPTESEIAQDWTSNQKWAEFNNNIVAAKSYFPYQAYTPTMIAPTTDPNIGNLGTIKGQYFEFQGWVFGSFDITIQGSGISAGTGAGGYGIKLPTLMDNVFHMGSTVLNNSVGSAHVIGEGCFTDASSALTCGTLAFDWARINGIDYMRPVTEVYSGKTVQWMGPGFPVPIAAGDALSGNFAYKKG